MKRLFIILITALGLWACGFDSTIPPNPYEPATTLSETTAMSSLAAASSAAASTQAGLLKVSFTPVSAGGTYAPKNVNATWITDASGKWVTNLVAHGKTRVKYLYNWRSDYSKTIVIGVDGVASATVSSFTPFVGSWNTSGKAAGTYTLHTEFTSKDGQGPYASVQFQLGSTPFDTIVQFSNFKNVHLVYAP